MSILYALESIRNPVLDAFFSAVTELGGEITFFMLGIVVYWCVSKKYGYYLMASAMIGIAVNQLLKIFCRVPRPWVRDPDFTIVESARAGATGYSFPSGHTQNAAGVLGGVARFTKHKAVRVVFIVLAALIAFSRLYLGVHYPTDVAVGLVCGVALVFALYPLCEKSDEDPKALVTLFWITAAAAVAAALFLRYRRWPADIDVSNLYSSVASLYLVGGWALALAVAIPIERKYIDFEPKAPLWAQLLKAAVGLALLLGLRAVLTSVLPVVFGSRPVIYGIRYGLLVLFAVLVWPLIFSRFARNQRNRGAGR